MKQSDGFGGFYALVVTNPRTIEATYTRDIKGRVTAQTSPGTSLSTSFNAKDQVTGTVSTTNGTTTTTSYDYGSPGTLSHALGQLVSSTATQGSNSQTSSYTYAWYDGPVKTQAVVSGTGQQAPGTSTYTIDAFGQLQSVSITGGTNGTTSYTHDAFGQGIVSSATINGIPYNDVWHRMGGVNIWHMTNRYDPRGGEQDGAGARYTVRSGDTLASIALGLWGDASLWYKLAEANGLTAQSSLTEGQSLILPPGVWRNKQSAQTFRPYDPQAFYGPTEPSPEFAAPAPRRGGKCGVFGKILLTVIAVAIVVVAPTSSFVLNAVIGSAVSQTVGVATGIQDKFSFKQLGLAAVGAAVGGFVGQALGTGAIAGSQILGDVIRGALTSAVTQGIGVATGLQKKFSWTGVAAAGIGAGIGGAVSRELSSGHYANGGDILKGVKPGSWVPDGDPSFAARAAGTMADAIAQAATRSAIKGTSFGDNLVASLPSALGNLAGRALGEGINRLRANAATRAEEKARAEQAQSVRQTQNSGTEGQTVGQKVAERQAAAETRSYQRATNRLSGATQFSGGESFSPTSIGSARSAEFEGLEPATPTLGNATLRVEEDGTIVLTAKATPKRGLGWRIDHGLGINVFGTNPRSRRNGGEDYKSNWQWQRSILTRLDDFDARSQELYQSRLARAEGRGGITSYVNAIDAGAFRGADAFTVGLGKFITSPVYTTARNIDGLIALNDTPAVQLVSDFTSQSGQRIVGGVTNGGIQISAGVATGRVAGSVTGSIRGFRARNATVVQGLPAFTVDGLPIRYDIPKLYHYTNEAGLDGILGSRSLNPSVKALTGDAYYGDGQYLTNIAPGTKTPAQLSAAFVRRPYFGSRYTHFVEIDTIGLPVVQGRTGVYVIHNNTPLDISKRLINSGMVGK